MNADHDIKTSGKEINLINVDIEITSGFDPEEEEKKLKWYNAKCYGLIACFLFFVLFVIGLISPYKLLVPIGMLGMVISFSISLFILVVIDPKPDERFLRKKTGYKGPIY